MSNPIQVNLSLNLSRPKDREAYYQLSKCPDAASRKDLLLSFTTARLRGTWIERLLSVLAVLVSGILVSLSVYFTYKFNSLVMPQFWGFLLSLSIVCFNSFALTFASYTKSLTRYVLVSLWIIGILYSIFTAFAGQYNSFRSYNAAEVQSTVTDKYEILLETKKELLSSKKQYLSEMEPYENLIKDLSSSPERKTEYPQTWRDANANLNNLRNKVAQVESRIDTINSQLLEIDTTQQVQNTTVYSWLSKILHIPAKFIELFVYTLPSVFIDLVSSILLKYALGNKQSRKENE